MQQQKTSHLYDKDTAVDFYEKRYTEGYMKDWPIETRRRIIEVVRSLELPETGEAVDFGCGNGVLTNVIKQALPPGWKVYGTDISTIAVENAQSQYPDCSFLAVGDSELKDKRFDFLFTHHVLEHVYDLPQVLEEADALMKDQAAILHILPCGNEGSFEHGICLLRKDGINPKLGNRFFFEEEGHVRRLTTEQLNGLYVEKKFVLAKEYYTNQYHGAINWITLSVPSLIQRLTDPSQAADEEARGKLKRLRSRLFFLRNLRYPAAFVENKFCMRGKTIQDYISLAFGLPLYIFAKPIDSYLKRRALEEWEKRKTERNGSEMYLFFKREKRV